MVTPEDERYLLDQAYVPEHLPSLMVGISKGEAFWRKPFVFFSKDDWLIFVGYPLGEDLVNNQGVSVLKELLQEFKPDRIWLIAPRIPEALLKEARSKEKDEYYRLNVPSFKLKRTLAKAVQKAALEVRVERSRHFSAAHVGLTQEFLRRTPLPPRIHELFLRMPDYVPYSPTSLLLNAWDRQNRLSAFFVLELGARNFLTYVLGCYSRDPYIPHASDFLFHEMILLAQEKGKGYIHLGLGVNEGIRRFKAKWGGVPFLSYESCELSPKPKRFFSWLLAIGGKT